MLSFFLIALHWSWFLKLCDLDVTQSWYSHDNTIDRMMISYYIMLISWFCFVSCIILMSHNLEFFNHTMICVFMFISWFYVLICTILMLRNIEYCCHMIKVGDYFHIMWFDIAWWFFRIHAMKWNILLASAMFELLKK